MQKEREGEKEMILYRYKDSDTRQTAQTHQTKARPIFSETGIQLSSFLDISRIGHIKISQSDLTPAGLQAAMQ